MIVGLGFGLSRASLATASAPADWCAWVAARRRANPGFGNNWVSRMDIQEAAIALGPALPPPPLPGPNRPLSPSSPGPYRPFPLSVRPTLGVCGPHTLPLELIPSLYSRSLPPASGATHLGQGTYLLERPQARDVARPRPPLTAGAFGLVHWVRLLRWLDG